VAQVNFLVKDIGSILCSVHASLMLAVSYVVAVAAPTAATAVALVATAAAWPLCALTVSICSDLQGGTRQRLFGIFLLKSRT
jgi:hypothetical protein